MDNPLMFITDVTSRFEGCVHKAQKEMQRNPEKFPAEVMLYSEELARWKIVGEKGERDPTKAEIRATAYYMTKKEVPALLQDEETLEHMDNGRRTLNYSSESLVKPVWLFAIITIIFRIACLASYGLGSCEEGELQTAFPVWLLTVLYLPCWLLFQVYVQRKAILPLVYEVRLSGLSLWKCGGFCLWWVKTNLNSALGVYLFIANGKAVGDGIAHCWTTRGDSTETSFFTSWAAYNQYAHVPYDFCVWLLVALAIVEIVVPVALIYRWNVKPVAPGVKMLRGYDIMDNPVMSGDILQRLADPLGLSFIQEAVVTYRIARVREGVWDLEKILDDNSYPSIEAKTAAVKKQLWTMKGARLITHMNVRMTSTLFWTVFVIFWQCRVLLARDSVEGLLTPREGFTIRASILINSYFAIAAVSRLDAIRRLLEEFQKAIDVTDIHPEVALNAGGELLLRQNWARGMAILIVLLVAQNLTITFGTLDVCNSGISHNQVFNPLRILKGQPPCAPLFPTTGSF